MTSEALSLAWQRERDWLGYAGLVPFVACAVVVWFSPEPASALTAADAMRYYAAVIASFLGAVHWGVASNGVGRTARLRWGVIPALAAWSLLLTPLPVALALFGLLFAVILYVDLKRLPLLDERYRRLRVPLTTVVMLSLWFAAIAVPEVHA